MDLSSTEIFPQIVVSLVIAIAIFFIYMVMETLYRAYLSSGNARVDIYPVTGSASKSFVQDPNNSNNKTLPYSENQLTGIEFSYSTFLYLSDKNHDDNTEGWRTVFYKGYTSGPFPLLGPGVFVSSANTAQSAPTLRVVMNTYDNWFNTVDVKQIPFNKWFHLAIVLRKNTLEVYINGNLANKKSFAGTLPYQNYQPLHFFPNKKLSPPNEWKSEAGNIKKNIPTGENFIVNGQAFGFISNMVYYSYAITYSEIQGNMNIGPSNEFDQDNMDKPPYLIDSWWTSRKTNN